MWYLINIFIWNKWTQTWKKLSAWGLSRWLGLDTPLRTFRRGKPYCLEVDDGFRILRRHWGHRAIPNNKRDVFVRFDDEGLEESGWLIFYWYLSDWVISVTESSTCGKCGREQPDRHLRRRNWRYLSVGDIVGGSLASDDLYFLDLRSADGTF